MTREERETFARLARMKAFDSLPPEVRQAVRDCPFYIDITVPTAGLNWDMVIARIKGVKSFQEAWDLHRELTGR